ncbi:hypothetical protein [Pelosinus sp. IPA-1]|uniref:hypothetical protein n=1 Tax=Pelosinus sp. IPA-1 TaxID=3029569 RepID=UPI0024362490|nr:hypothetical protein [Pelosinus sp. IPA-1]GMB00222.1 hypothetical protein PIPA1_30210 [Pelosinus sp. IPA-1]
MEIVLGDLKIAIPPENKIDFTGMRAMVKYDVPGDRPRYQDMGRDERTVKWSGIFYGDGAYQQALDLQALYDSKINIDEGTEKSGFQFLFEEISCRVLIKSYSYQYYRRDKIRYDIELVRLESDYDSKSQPKNDKIDKIEKAKSGLDKLKDDINKAMKSVNDVSKAAESVRQSLYNARKAYLSAVVTVTSPIQNMKQQLKNVKDTLDQTLATVNHSIGCTSTSVNRQELIQALQKMQTTIPLAQSLVLLAKGKSLGQRLDEVTSQFNTRRVTQGDTLRSIASDVLGSPHEWMILSQINRLTSSIIPAGMEEIKVPNRTNTAEINTLIEEQIGQLPRVVSDYLPRNLR